MSAPVDAVVEQAASLTPIETRPAADGVGYTWAEVESYFDANLAAEFWGLLRLLLLLSPLLSPALFLSSWAPIIRIVARLSVCIPQ